MSKEKFVTPEAEVVRFENEDIITASATTDCIITIGMHINDGEPDSYCCDGEDFFS